jgi:addiction module RelE/StbE family toxin
MKIIWSDNASNDLEEIKKYIARDNINIAESFIYKLVSSVSKLSDFPLLGSPVDKYSQLDIHFIIYKNYKIFYKININNILILTVVHGSRNFSIFDSIDFEDEES